MADRVNRLRKGEAAEEQVRGRLTAGEKKPLNHEQERIREWLKDVRFRKTLIGGVDEADVWKKIAELDSMYETALAAERARYDALLKAYSVSQKKKYANLARSVKRREADDETDE